MLETFSRPVLRESALGVCFRHAAKITVAASLQCFSAVFILALAYMLSYFSALSRQRSTSVNWSWREGQHRENNKALSLCLVIGAIYGEGWTLGLHDSHILKLITFFVSLEECIIESFEYIDLWFQPSPTVPKKSLCNGQKQISLSH